jgi:hypothetical protein
VQQNITEQQEDKMLNILRKFKRVEDNCKEIVSAERTWQLKDKIDKPNYLALKASIKGHAAMGRALREEANKSRGLVRQNLREMKRGSVAWVQRINLLCLGLLKGRHYRDVEPISDINADCLEKAVSEKLCRITTWKYTRESLDNDLKRFFDDVD